MQNLAGILGFMRAAETGSFARAAQALGVSPAAVSRSIWRLEQSLGARLFNRTTRRLALTDEGALYLEQCRPAIVRLQQASDVLKERRGEPSGRLRVSATVGFGRRHIVPLLPEFLRRYPGIELDFRLDDQFADLVEDRIDVAIRNGRLTDRRIIARQLAPMQLVVCGAPAYIRRHGAPSVPEDLAGHRCINFRLAATGRAFPWEFERAAARFTLAVNGPLIADDPDTVLAAALAGVGLAQLGSYQCAEHIAAGRLVPVLTDYIAGNRGHYILYASRQHLPQRIRAFVDFVAGAIDPAAMTLPTPLNRRGTSPPGGRNRGSVRSGSSDRSGRTRGAARAG